MKKIIFTFCLFVFSFISKGQTVLFYEDFEIVDSVTNIPSSGAGWADDQTLFASGAHSYHATITNINDTNILEIDGFDPATPGFGFITFSFKHIAKVDFFDRCILEYSVDGGFTWIAFDNTNSTYIGSSATWPTYFSYMAPSYPTWVPNQPTLLPDNSWWKTELFDVSTMFAFASTDCRIRFKMFDNNNNGGALNYGWNLDDINITGAYCELDAPVMTQNGGLAGAVYGAGPFNISYESTDASGISYGYLVYTITDSLGNVTGPDSVALTNPFGNTWVGQIDTISEGDTVCYYAYTVDNSGCFNYTYVPVGGCTSFYFASAIGFPYCNSFDNLPDTTWSVITVGGSAWEQGVPTTPPINSTYSGANCWDVDLANVYQPNTETYLYSPLFAWNNNPNVKLSFYQNRDAESNWDGVVLQCDTSGSGVWFDIGVINDPNGTNWYNTTNINSNPGHDAWDGNSNGWIKSDIDLYQLNNATGTVQFRFEFTSDGSVQNTSFAIDEFCLKLPQPFDAGVTTITSPTAEVPAGSASPVTVTVKNYGFSPLNAGDFDIEYSIDGVLAGSAPYAGVTLNPGVTSAAITLPSTFIVPSGAFLFCAWTSLASDGDHTNDTLCKNVLGIPTFTPPYCDNFDTGTVYWNGLTPLAGTTLWELGVPNYGSINTAKSAPNAWVTNLTSAYTDGSDVELRSPYFDLSSPTTFNSNVSFWMNRNIQSNSDGLVLESTINNGATWQVFGTGPIGTNWYNNPTVSPNFTGPGWDGNTGGWVRCEYPAAILNGNTSVRFRFHFESDFFGTAEGAGIDDFCIKPPVPNDAGVKRIIAPGPQVTAGVNIVPNVVVKNYGNNVLTTFPVTYRVNGVVQGTGTYTGTLNPGDSANFNTWTGFIAPDCNFSFDSYTELVADGDLNNDSTATSVTGLPKFIVPSSGAICENFDSISCWSSTPSANGSSKWELGTPNFGVTNSAYSPPNSWDINLSTAYDNNALTYLYTAKYDFTNAVNATLSFWHNWSTENGWDGVRVEVDSNGSGVWHILGTGPNDANGVNWYNKATINSSQQAAWDGTSSGVFGVPLWIQSSHNLDSLSGKPDVQFRFVFTSDASVIGDGHSIDDFCIRTPFPHDIGVSKIIRPGPLEGAGNVLAPQVIIKNYGSNTETTSPVVYSINNGVPVSFTWTGNLAPNKTDTVTLPTFTVGSNSFLFCSWTELINDGDLTNDSLCGNSFGVPVVIPTYADNFDTGQVSFVNVPGNQGATNWELGVPNFGQTNSVHSAPNAWDVNLNVTYANNDSCFLYTPIFDLSGKKAPVFRFWHNRNLDNFNGDGVYVQYTINGGTTWKILGAAGLSVAQGALNWYNSPNIFASGTPAWNGSSAGWIFSYLALDTTIFNGAPNSQAQFRFVFKSDGFNQFDGYSVDDFELFIPTALTVSPQAITGVNKILTPGPQFIRTKIRNKGTQTVGTANVTLKIDGNIIVTDAVTFTPAMQGASYTQQGGAYFHTFSIPWSAGPGAHDVCVYTDSPNTGLDEFQGDDTLCVNLSVFDSVTVSGVSPYCSDFELGPQWVTLNALTYTPPNNPGLITWDLGTPTKACLNSTHSGVQAWSTLLAANYPNRDTSALFTPVFNIDPSKCYKLSFWHKFDTEQFQDGGNVEYSVDSGNTWSLLGFGGEPNWYNSTFITALGGSPPLAGFSGTNCTWAKAEHEYLPFGSTVIFRFRFGSDFSFNKEGWAIDDVCFEELATSCFVGVPEVGNSKGLELGQNYPNPANATTSFDYVLPENGKVQINLVNLMGQVIATPVNGNQQSGKHTVSINTEELAPGIYFYTLKFNDRQLVKKMVIAK